MNHAEAIAALIVLDAVTKIPAYDYVRGEPVYGWNPTALTACLNRNPEFEGADLVREVTTRPPVAWGTGGRRSDFAVKVTPAMRRQIVELAEIAGLKLEIQRGGWLKVV